MNDTTDTTDDVDPLQCDAIVQEAAQVTTGDAASVEDEGKASESQARDFEDYVSQFYSDQDEGLDGSDLGQSQEQEAEVWSEDGTHSHAELIAQTQNAIKATQAAVKAVASKAKKKS